MNNSLCRIAVGLIMALSLWACGKTISVKEDATNYVAAETKIQNELKPRQQALMQKLQAMQATPEKIETLLPEINSFISDAKSQLQQVKPQTDAVKKFQAQELQSIDTMSSFMTTVVEAVKTKDPSKIQEAQGVFIKAMKDLQTAKADLMKEADK
ncbi:MAG: hypothetical protein ACRCV6_05755 [Formosimonas sp.]